MGKKMSQLIRPSQQRYIQDHSKTDSYLLSPNEKGHLWDIYIYPALAMPFSRYEV